MPYRLSKIFVPLDFSQQYIAMQSPAVTAVIIVIYTSAEIYFLNRKKPPADITVYSQPPNRAAVTAILCLTGAVSLVHVRFGLLRFNTRPKNDDAATYIRTSRRKLIHGLVHIFRR